MVKLKPAKRYLKEYFLVPEEAEAYQENDIMLGVRFLHELAQKESLPLVICLALGSNMGGHTGTSPLSSYLNAIAVRAGRCIILAGGNEANQGHHYYGVMGEGDPYQDVEVRVAEREQGVMMELWSNTLDVFSVSLISPSGEEIPRVTSGQKNWMFDFLFENTVIYVNFQTLNLFSGDQLIVVRMADPSPGIWRIRVYGERIVDGVYNIWLPVTGFVSSETVFLNSNPDITLTEPGNTETPITTGAYRSSNGSIYMDSGRGFTRNGRIKPDLAAPGVAVAAYGPENRAVNLTGTSAAAAVTAGAGSTFTGMGSCAEKHADDGNTGNQTAVGSRCGSKRVPPLSQPLLGLRFLESLSGICGAGTILNLQSQGESSIIKSKARKNANPRRTYDGKN